MPYFKDRSRLRQKVVLNGVDPNGEWPPDEILFHPEDDHVELVRQRIDSDYYEYGYELRVKYGPHDFVETYKDAEFTKAFSVFSMHVSKAVKYYTTE